MCSAKMALLAFMALCAGKWIIYDWLCALDTRGCGPRVSAPDRTSRASRLSYDARVRPRARLLRD